MSEKMFDEMIDGIMDEIMEELLDPEDLNNYDPEEVKSVFGSPES